MADYTPNQERTIKALEKSIQELDRTLSSFNQSFGDKLKNYFTKGEAGKTRAYTQQARDLRQEADEYYAESQNSDLSEGDKAILRLKSKKLKRESKIAQENAKSSAKAAKANAYSVAAQAVGETAKKVSDMVVKINKIQLEEQKIRLDAAKQSIALQTNLIGQAMSSSLKIGAGTVTSSIKENVYASMDNVLELGKKSMSTQFDLSKIQFDKNVDLQTKSIEKEVAIVGGVLSEVSGVLSQIPNPYTAIIGGALSVVNSIYSATKEIEMAKLQYAKEAMSAKTELQKNFLENVHSLVGTVTPIIKKVDDVLMELDNSAHALARSFGYNGEQLVQYTKSASKINVEMAALGKTFEDFKKYQEAYIATSGRNVMMNGQEGTMLTSLDTLFGLADGEAAQIMGAMNIFNTSIESGSDMMFEMYKTANKMGVSNQKFAKDMQKNLKLAEKYQFKGGVEGMMKMSLWAQKTRFNMDSLASALEKMHTGNIEDVIQTSAKLNVLGGNAALMSDPMAMLFNAYADPAQYAKNMKEMVAGFGHFNAKTGETEFNINEQMRMEAMAAAMGVSKEDFFNMARQEKKAGAVKRALGGRYDEETTDLLTQHATFNKKTKKWEVNVMGKDGTVTAKDIKTLEKEDIESIFPEDTQMQLVEYTKGIYSLLQQSEVIDKSNVAKLAQASQNIHQQQTKAQQGLTQNYNTTEFDNNTELIANGLEQSTTSLDLSLKMAEKVLENQDFIKQYYQLSNESTEQMTKDIDQYAKALSVFLAGDENKWLAELSMISGMAASVAEIQAAVMTIAGQKDVSRSEKNKAALAAEQAYGKGTDAYYEALGEIFDVNNDLWYGNKGTLKNRIQGGEWKIDKQGQLLETKTGLPVWLNNVPEGERGITTVNDWETQLLDIVLPGMGGLGHKHARQHLRNVLLEKSGMKSEGYGHLFSRDELGRAAHSSHLNPGMNAAWGMIQHETGWGWNKVNDVIISPKHGVYETDPEDTIVASKPGGSLDRASQRRASTPENINLTVNGTLKLSSGNQSIDLMELLRNDPAALREITKAVIVEGSRTQFGGRPEYAPSRYTSFS